MCRLLAVISPHSIAASYPLLEAPQSLWVQSQIDKKRKQGDGWGFGYYSSGPPRSGEPRQMSSGKPRVFKSSGALYRERTRLSQASKKIEAEVLVGHVRWASNPLKLPRRELIGLDHTQPFQHKDWLFVHNGTLYIPREVKAALGPWEKYVKGKNDSEVLFYWLMKHINGRNDIAGAVRQSIRGLHRIWQSCRKRYPLYSYPYHGLNWVLTNGRRLAAFCYADPRGLGKSKALCRPGQRYYDLQWRDYEGVIAVASEPFDRGSGWDSLGHGRLLVADRRAGGIHMQIRKVL